MNIKLCDPIKLISKVAKATSSDFSEYIVLVMNEYHILGFILLAGVIVGKACERTNYIISPVINDETVECLPERCLTLPQFTANSTFIRPNATLIFLNGDHFLKSDLIVTGTINFFIVSSDNLVSIICEPSTDLSFTSISFFT